MIVLINGETPSLLFNGETPSLLLNGETPSLLFAVVTVRRRYFLIS